jgi:hypothetical protein
MNDLFGELCLAGYPLDVNPRKRAVERRRCVLDASSKGGCLSPLFSLVCLVYQVGHLEMTLSSLQAQAPRVILSGFSPSNCTEKTKENRLARLAN